MSAGTRITYEWASKIATDLAEILRPGCERCEVVGSIRRGKISVGDIEILALPKLYEVEEMGGLPLYADEKKSEFVSALDDLLGSLELAGEIDRLAVDHPGWGRRQKKFSFRGVTVDLYVCVPPAQYGILKALRTGPEAFSKRLVTCREASGGWGYLPAGLKVREGQLWDDEISVACPDEAEFFAAIGLSYVEPEDRGDGRSYGGGRGE